MCQEAQEAQKAQECCRQSRLAAQTDALEVDLQRLMIEALADLDGWIE
jgi:hypothetical protein